MSIQVKIEDIIEEMELQFEESHALLNIQTGDIVVVTSEELRAAEEEEPLDDLPDWERENRLVAIDVVENFDHYIELPTEDEINEYGIMADFCLTVTNPYEQEILLKTIKGKGAFRRFKDKIYELGLDNQWYAYRDEALKCIAVEWCRDNKINFINFSQKRKQGE
ncbi:hypothetical protein J2S74_005194 [Evansella vedderi]|uniref:Uncharacterized protein n=1 Tax=Evansella vedderi TaxID=38282 RepID=A0ABU0A2L7_9BACI|nr:UPF0158 family protein [Evansella vedderi]MDQ0257732.1 hypothetical protein [Evansella vedderi]